MIAGLGHFTLILTLLTAAMQSVLSLVGAARGGERWMAVARPAVHMQCVLVSPAYGALIWAFVSSDFSVLYVAANSNGTLPLPYRVTAVWGGREGSMLLWTAMLALWSLAVSLSSRQLPLPVVARVLGVMGAISTGLLLFLLFASNPFLRLLPPAMEGRDLNSLLQDPDMVPYPPMLYMGYVGFAMALSFTVTVLLSGRLDATRACWSRPWTITAWACLTTGIMLGSAWAYYELDWGDWWFWDLVENASFMPQLAGTALIHLLAVTEKRGVFRAWTALPATFTFSLSLLGMLLIRSDVLTSVHAFAADPKRGLFILALLGIVTGGALGLLAWRAKQLFSNAPEGATFPLFACKSFLLVNNVLLAVAAATVLFGALYPFLLDMLRLGKISVGPAYFEQVFVPLMSLAVLLMGAAPLARWRHGTLPSMAVRLRWAAVASVAVGLGLAVLYRTSALAGLGLTLAVQCLVSALVDLAEKLRQPGNRLTMLRQLPPSYFGMFVTHVGVGVFTAGVTLVLSQETLHELPMRVGGKVEVGGYMFRLASVASAQGPNYDVLRGHVDVSRNGKPVATLLPERRLCHSQENPTTEVAVDSGITRDLYVALSESFGQDNRAMRIYIKPFVSWIWAGCVLMVLGGLLAVYDRRYRLRRRSVSSHAALDTARGGPSLAMPVTEELR